MKRPILIVAAGLLLASPATSQEISCPAFSKCVPDDAQCFNSEECSPSGFVCKADADELKRRAQKVSSNYSDFRDCVRGAQTMDDVATCIGADLDR